MKQNQIVNQPKVEDQTKIVNNENPDVEDILEESLEDSFPASDPPSSTPITSVGRKASAVKSQVKEKKPDDSK